MNNKKMTKQDMLLQYIKTLNDEYGRGFNIANIVDEQFAIHHIQIANKNALSTMLSTLKKYDMLYLCYNSGYFLTPYGKSYIDCCSWSDDFQDVIDDFFNGDIDDEQENLEDDESEHEFDDEDDEPSIDNSTYDAAMKAYTAAMDAYRTAMDAYKIAMGI